MPHYPELPPELWTHIWSFACTDDGTIGRILSRVSRHVYATSAPVRLQSITLTGLRDLLAFAYMIRTSPNVDLHARQVRYLTVMADAMPVSSQELEEEKELRDRLTASNSRFDGIRNHSSPSIPTTPEQRKASEKERERFFLHTLFALLRLFSLTLLELELSLQAIRSPNFFSHLRCSSSIWPHDQSNFGSLEFPKLFYLFYACPPSGVLPWSPVTRHRASRPHTPTSDMSSDILARQEGHIPFICPHLKELTIVCDDSEAGDPDDAVVEEEEEESVEEPPKEEAPDVDMDTSTMSQSSPLTTLCPSIRTLTLLASSPAQAIIAIYSASSRVDENASSIPSIVLDTAIAAELELAAAAAEWESLFVPYTYFPHEDMDFSMSIPSQTRYSALESAVDAAAMDRMSKGMPKHVERVICAPRVRWDRSWDAFKNGVQKGLAEQKRMEKEAKEMNAVDQAERRVEICVVHRSEVC